MRQIHVVYADANAPLAEQDRPAWLAKRHEQESKLCSNLFVYALQAGQYEVSLAVHVTGTLACICTSVYKLD